MKKLLVIGLVMLLVVSSGFAVAAKPHKEPHYRAIPLKAPNTCIEACGAPPNGEDLEAQEKQATSSRSSQN